MFVFKPTVCAILPAEKDAKQSRRRLFAVTPIAQNYLILSLTNSLPPITHEAVVVPEACALFPLEYGAKIYIL
jgi:hypothetical protein